MLDTPPAKIKAHFGLAALEGFPPRHNIAPTQPILLVIDSPVRERPGRLPMLARWGLIPAFVKDPREMPLLFNARCETVAERNSFRAALRHRRCLVPASGFYEWRKCKAGPSQPFLVRRRDGGPIALAGLMETYLAADGSEIDTAAILTTQANGTLSPIHERMPVIVPQAQFARWLNCRDHEPRDVAHLMAPAPDDALEAVPVEGRITDAASATRAPREDDETDQGRFEF